MFVCDVVQVQGSISKCLRFRVIEVSWKTETLLSLHVCWTAGSIALIDSGGELNRGLCVLYACRPNCCGSATWDPAPNSCMKSCLEVFAFYYKAKVSHRD